MVVRSDPDQMIVKDAPGGHYEHHGDAGTVVVDTYSMLKYYMYLSDHAMTSSISFLSWRLYDAMAIFGQAELFEMLVAHLNDGRSVLRAGWIL
jgi:hypothetical protein